MMSVSAAPMRPSSPRIRRLALVLTGCALLGGAYQAAGQNVAGELATVKRAMGGDRWDDVRTLHIQGKVEIGDLQGTYDAWFDLRGLRSFVDLRFSNPVLGEVRNTDGWNGTVAWSADQTGDVRVEDAEEARRNAASNAYSDAFAYLVKGAQPADLQVKPDAAAAGRPYHVMLVTPPAGPPFELWIDPVTNRVARTVPVTGADRDVTSYSDFHEVSGLLLPFRIEERGADSGKPLAVTTATAVEINRDPPGAIFDPPPAAVSGLEFPTGSEPVRVDFSYADGHIHLPVSIDGHRMANFVFDTGMNDTLASTRAAALNLKVVNAGAAYGAGPDAVENGMTKVGRIEIGGLVMRDQIVDVTALPGAGGPPLDGGIGYEVARRAVVTIDYAARTLSFSKPEVFKPPAGAIGLPLRFASLTEILVEASVNGIGGEFQLDTGQDLGLTINRPFAERHGLLRKYGAGTKNKAEGVGGETEIVGFKPTQFSLGGLKISAGEAAIMLSKSGSGAEEYVAGVIGNRILQNYKVTLDYAHRMVYLEKAPRFKDLKESVYSPIPPDFSKEGRGGWLGLLRLRRVEGEAAQIVEVGPDSAMARAGIEPGDWLLAVNGASTARLSISKLFGPMAAPPGSVVRLTIRRGAAVREVTLHTE